MSALAAVELAGGLLGIVGSIVLARPAIADLTNRKFWDRLKSLGSIKGATAKDIVELKLLLLDDILGGYRFHARCVAAGSLFLALGFAAIAVAGGIRLSIG